MTTARLTDSQLDRLDHLIDTWYKRWDFEVPEEAFTELKTFIRLNRAVIKNEGRKVGDGN